MAVVVSFNLQNNNEVSTILKDRSEEEDRDELIIAACEKLKKETSIDIMQAAQSVGFSLETSYWIEINHYSDI